MKKGSALLWLPIFFVALTIALVFLPLIRHNMNGNVVIPAKVTK